MNMFFDWWFATSPRLRQLCWAFWLLMLVTLIFLSSTHHEERDALIRLRASHHQQWAALYRLVDTTPFSEEKTLPFSPLDFQLSGAQLVSWHPSAQGGGASAGAGKSAAGKSQYNPAIRRRGRTGESGGEATECQREYDRR